MTDLFCYWLKIFDNNLQTNIETAFIGSPFQTEKIDERPPQIYLFRNNQIMLFLFDFQISTRLKIYLSSDNEILLN